MIKMKKIIAGLTAITILCGMAYADNMVISNMVNNISVSAETLDNSFLDYVNYDGTGITITGCDKSATEIEIPAEIDGVPVISIGDYAFSGCTSLTSVTIPDSVTDIYSFAFNECSSLTSVKIPDSVVNIWDYAFANCTSLTEVKMPDNITNIGVDAFYNTAILNNQNTNIQYIDNWLINAFDIEKADIQEGTKFISNGAFRYCTSLTEVIIPNSVESIGYGAFSYCTSLTDITIPDSVEFIGGGAFSNTAILNNQDTDLKYIDNWLVQCDNNEIEKADVKDGTKAISNGVFDSCNSLTEVNIPDSVTSIGAMAFYGCKSLTSVTIPDSVTIIDKGAFHDCKSLTSVTIPDSVTSVGIYAFGYYSDENDNMVKIENFIIYGVKGSAAETYAIENGFNFVEIESTSTETTGDIDGDGETTSSDSLNILQAVTSITDLTDEQKKLADLDGDGEITSSDALIVLQMIVGLR